MKTKVTIEVLVLMLTATFVHLSAHLKTPDILKSEQITLYNKLRGYSSDDPCENVPRGHDPEMWKKHHNCP
jgi:hypothetical protein